MAGREDLVVEVAPGQLPYERLTAGAALLPCPVGQFGGGDRTEVQMGESREVASPARSSWPSS